MEIKTLENINLDTLTQTFNKAFENYFVPFKLTPQLLSQRIQNSGIDLSSSYGAFDDDKLVAFMLIAIDDLNGIKSAYNGGTGVIPDYRGQKLVKQMYDIAIPKYKSNGVHQLTLEVICENEKAIKAYESVGMKIDRRLACYAGNITLTETEPIDLEITVNEKPNWTDYRLINEYEPTWDHQQNSILRAQGSYKYVELHQVENLIGYAIFNPVNGAIAQFGVSKAHRRKGIGTQLFSALAKMKSPLKLNNVDTSYDPSKQFLTTLGLKNTIDQFEMKGMI